MPPVNALFAVFALSDPAAVAPRMDAILPWLSLSLTEGQWLVVAPAATTTKEICDTLGLSDGTTGSGIVARVENYFGRSPASTWEWITAKIGTPLATQAA